MGNFFDEEDDDPVDLAAVEARHAQMEAEEALEQAEKERKKAVEKGKEERKKAGEKLKKGEEEPEKEDEKTEAIQKTETAQADSSQVHDWESIVEAVLFTMGKSVEVKQLAAAIGQSEPVAKRVAERLKQRYEDEQRGMRILELENAYQMCTCADYYENLIRVASAPKKHVLSDIILETLSIIAYRQPVTKMEINKIRGVSSDHAVNRLVEYGLVYEAGRLDAPGRPALFATTEEFLRRFGISSMVDLPTVNPEQEEEIIQEVEEELQMRLDAQKEEPAETPQQEAADVLAELDEEK